MNTLNARAPDWWSPWTSSNLYLPIQPNYQTLTLNKHVSIDRFTHPEPSTLEYEFISIDSDTANKKVKNYEKSIAATTKQLTQARNEQEIKILTSKLKCLHTKQTKQISNQHKITKNFTIGIPLSDIQHQIVNRWYAECLEVYNMCVQIKEQNLVDSTDLYNMSRLRAIVFNRIFESNQREKQACYETLGDEVRAFLSNLKSCHTSLERKVISHFSIKPRNLSKNRSLSIRGTAIGKRGLFPEKLGPIRGWNKIYQQIIRVCGKCDRYCDSRLVYDDVLKRYTLNIPYFANKQSVTIVRKRVVALDPGEKIFQTYYSPEESGRIGYDIRLSILQEEKNIRRLERIVKHKRNKQQKKLRNPKAIKRRIQIKYNRIRNIVSELHHQTAKWLTDHYEHIYIPSFETQQMISNGNNKSILDKRSYKRRSRLNKRVKFVLNSLSHYRFRQHLQQKCLEKGCKMEIVNESYTSMTCGGCGKQSKNYRERVKICGCGCQIDRDLNGSRNILIKSFCS